MTMTQQYTVTGMTCPHCAEAVGQQVGSIEGVDQVDVELDTGAVTVTSERKIPFEAMEAAVEEAGYALRHNTVILSRLDV